MSALVLVEDSLLRFRHVCCRKHAKTSASREVIMRIQATHTSAVPLKLLAMEFAYSATSTSPAITGGGTGRPSPSPRFAATSFLLHKSHLPLLVSIGNSAPLSWTHATSHCRPFLAPPLTSSPLRRRLDGPTTRLPLIRFAVGRSGDKGDTANIAFLARSPAAYKLIKAQVTPDVVRDVLGDLLDPRGSVQRYDCPGTNAVNFVVSRCLGGGGLGSIRFDKQVSAGWGERERS